jgi:plasmid stability protein
MATVTLKNSSADPHQRLRDSAARHHRSLNREIIAQLDASLTERSRKTDGLLTELEALHSELLMINHSLVDGLKQQGRA